MIQSVIKVVCWLQVQEIPGVIPDQNCLFDDI